MLETIYFVVKTISVIASLESANVVLIQNEKSSKCVSCISRTISIDKKNENRELHLGFEDDYRESVIQDENSGQRCCNLFSCACRQLLSVLFHTKVESKY